MEDLTGKQLGQYQIVEKLGEGGMATVYKAFQPNMERLVALKILPRHLASAPDFVSRFKTEARVIANLGHPNILPVHDFGEAEGYTYLVMRYVEGGKTLSSLLLGQPLPSSQIRRLIGQIASALDYAHSQNIIHRDVKPSNVLLDGNNNCLLSDFGLAKVLINSEHLTTSGAFLGTPKYASPEQCLGSSDIDERSDIYSLGVILYEMTTGRPPFDAETPMGVVIKHIHDPLPMPRRINPDLPESVERVILKALSKDANGRYSTAGELSQAYDAAVDAEAKETRSRSVPSSLRERIPDINKKWIAAGIFGMIVLCFLCLGSLWRMKGIFPSESPTPMFTTPVAEMPMATNTQHLITITDTQEPSTATFSPKPKVTTTSTGTAPPSPTVTFTPLPTLGIGSTAISPMDNAVLIYVPEGAFLRGSYFDTLGWVIDECAAGVDTREECESEYEDETPQLSIYLKSFWVDKTQVTNEMYAAFLNTSASQSHPIATLLNPGKDYLLLHETNNDWKPKNGYENHPVIGVTWYGANAYCQWAGRRLLTEAEWEKSARGTDGRSYPWGEGVSCSLAQYKDCSGETIPVGVNLAGTSPYGVLDMAGNVWDWLMDWYDADYYKIAPESDPPGPSSGEFRAVRGGSWRSEARFLRSAFRDYRSPEFVGDNLGFRCAQDITP